MDGIEVARRIRSMPGGDEVRLIAVTGWGQEEDRRRTAEAGFDDHLIKPVGVQEVLPMLVSGRRGSLHK
jgi:CheY-like chemotaxis protein